MTKKLVGLFASVALLSSGMALANEQQKGSKQQTQSSQQMGSEAYGGAGTSGQMGMGEKQITGTVVKSSSDKISLRTDNGIIDLKVDKQTKFQDPTVKRAKDLKEGQQVRTSFDIKGDQNVAKSISLETGTGGGMMQPDQGINQPPSSGGSGMEQNKGSMGGSSSGQSGAGDMGGSGNQGEKTY
ncbi:MAG: hypothetical protein ACXU86_22255 [Archangium sp.]